MAVADSPWPFLVLFLIFDFLNFFDFFFFGSKKKKKTVCFRYFGLGKFIYFLIAFFFRLLVAEEMWKN